MAAANKNWPRWMRASVNKYLKDIAIANSIPSVIEGVDDRDEAFMSADLRAELRFIGPYTIKYNPSFWVARAFVNVLVISALSEIKNRYLLDQLTGEYYTALDAGIPIFKYGTGVDDDQSLLGCLTTTNERSTPVRVIDFGEIDATDRQRQSMVTATYTIDLQE